MTRTLNLQSMQRRSVQSVQRGIQGAKGAMDEQDINKTNTTFRLRGHKGSQSNPLASLALLPHLSGHQSGHRVRIPTPSRTKNPDQDRTPDIAQFQVSSFKFHSRTNALTN